MRRRRPGIAALLALLAGCIPEEGPMMLPGSDCMQCHGTDEARAWTVAGTIAGVEGARVTVTDRSGWSFTLRSNRAGNFYTAEGVAFPIHVSVDGVPMPDPPAVAQGSCNCCHPGGVGAGGASTTCTPRAAAP